MMKAFRILDNVFCVGGSELTAPEDGSVYLLGDAEELWLIDSGCGGTVEVILGHIEQLGFNPQRISKVIATHGHIDHSGGLAEFQERFDAEIVAHSAEVEALEGRAPARVAAEFYGLSYRPVRVTTVLREPRETFYLGRQALILQHAPGHTPGSIVAWGDFPGGRVLFGQDLHGPLHSRWGSDRRAWKASLRELLALRADILAEGHFGIISPAEKVEEFIQDYLYY